VKCSDRNPPSVSDTRPTRARPCAPSGGTIPSRRNRGFSKGGQQSHPRLRNEPPHFVENAPLVVHGAPRVCHADGEIELRPDGKAGGVPGHEVQRAPSASTTGIDEIRVFVVHSDADSETNAQHGEMASNAAPHIDYGHFFDDNVVEHVNLGLQEARISRGCVAGSTARFNKPAA
jgi:hypothetical protein